MEANLIVLTLKTNNSLLCPRILTVRVVSYEVMKLKMERFADGVKMFMRVISAQIRSSKNTNSKIRSHTEIEERNSYVYVVLSFPRLTSSFQVEIT